MGKGNSGGSGSTQSTATSYNTNIPEYAQPYVTSMLNATQQQLFNVQDGQVTGFAPYIPYSANPADYVAGFTPMQTQAFQSAANLQTPSQFGAASNYAANAGQGAMGSAGTALGYGSKGSQYGDTGAQLGIQGGQRFGESGYQSGLLGQELGITGGDFYGMMGAGYGAQGADYGAQAAGLSNAAQRYGAAGQAAGLRGEQTAGQYAAMSNLEAQLAAARGENLANQYAQQATQQGNIYGGLAASLAPQAQVYGQNAADIGAMGLEAQSYGRDVGEQARQYAAQAAGTGAQYAQQATSPSAIQAYMSPYQQAVTDVQKQAAQREFDIQSQSRKAVAAKSGAYGGARQAIEQAEAARNLNTQLQNIQATGSQAAYDKAIQSLQYGTGAGLQGLQGAQAGLGTALQGGQLGLSGIGQAIAGQQAGTSALGQAGNLYGLGLQGAGMGLQAGQLGLAGTSQGLQAAQTGLSAGQLGLSGAQAGMQGAQTGLQGIGQAGSMYGLGIQGAQAGMQGAGVGLQGVNTQLAGTAQGMQGAQVGLAGVDRQLAGTAQGMQGAQVGLQGVQGAQAGYGLANQAAGTLGQLGTQQLAAQQGIVGLQNQLGAQQQAYQQQIINQAIQDYANAQQYPLTQLGTMSNMLRGLPLQSSTTQQYVAQPNSTTQAIGALGAGASLYKAMGSKKGGIIDADKYAEGGVVGSVESKLYDMEPEDLQKELKSPSPTIQKMARRIMLEKMGEGKAGGGIIAFADATDENNQSLVKEPEVEPQGIAAVEPQAPVQKAATPQKPVEKVAPIDTSLAGIKRAWAQGIAEDQMQQAKPLTEGMTEYKSLIGQNEAAQERRKQLMAERANSEDEARRQNYFRAAEFFANWGATPGNTLSAGLSSLKSVIPSVISDQKELKKYNRGIDDALYDLQKADRAEQLGSIEYAAKLRQDAGDKAYKKLKGLSDITEAELRSKLSGSGGVDADTKKFEKAEKLTQNALKGNVEYQSIVAQAKTGGEPTADNLARIAQIEDSYRKFYYGQAGLPTGAEVNVPESPSAIKAKREKLEQTIEKNTPTFDMFDSKTKQKKREDAQRELDAMGGSSDNANRKPLSSFQK